MKKPILLIGILFFTIFLLDLSRRGILPFRKGGIKATSCTSAVVMLNKRVPANWSTECNDNNLTVRILSSVKVNDPKDLSLALYRELANHLIFISKNSLNESLERTFIIRVQLIHKEKELNAITEGQYLAKMATLNRPNFIAQHLKSTVQVQERDI